MKVEWVSKKQEANAPEEHEQRQLQKLRGYSAHFYPAKLHMALTVKKIGLRFKNKPVRKKIQQNTYKEKMFKGKFRERCHSRTFSPST